MKNTIINAKATQEKLELARHFRQNMTHAEMKLWKRLRANRLDGLHFRRQQVILGFIVDFYCHKYRLIVEIDGEVHDSQKEQDLEREKVLTQNGFRIIRFTNAQVENNIEEVLTEILGIVKGI
jgi:very-short-patch-repair endonuclease